MMTKRPPDDPRSTPIMLRRHLIQQGWKDNSIARMVRDGHWARPRHGAYVEGSAWRAADAIGKHEITARAVLDQAKSELVLSHLTAAAVWDLPFWDLVPDSVHGTRRDGRCGRSEAGVTQHRGVLLPGDVVTRHGVEVVSATRLALELPTVTDLEHALSFTNELLHRGHTTKDQLWARYESMTRWPHSLTTEVVLRLSTPKCESVGEHRFLCLCWRQGLPAPECQHVIRDEAGDIVAILDFAWPEHGVYAEFDGKVKYTLLLKAGQTVTDVVLAEKRREERISELTGWQCLRIVWSDLYQPEATALRVRRALDRGNRVA